MNIHYSRWVVGCGGWMPGGSAGEAAHTQCAYLPPPGLTWPHLASHGYRWGLLLLCGCVGSIWEGLLYAGDCGGACLIACRLTDIR